MRIPVNQISEDGWTRTLDLPLAGLSRVVEAFGPQDGVLRAHVTLKNHRGCIAVKGEIAAELRLPCHLCLDEGTVLVAGDLELMVAPEASWQAGPREGSHLEVQLSSADLDTSFYDGEELDLTQLLEDELLIAAPESLGEENAEGICGHCGRNVEALLAERQPDAQAAREAFHPFRELAERMKPPPRKTGSKE